MTECWICFEDCERSASCKCKSMKVHSKCLALWQFRSGKNTCDICNDTLDDWRYLLRPNYDAYITEVERNIAIFGLSNDGSYSLRIDKNTNLGDLIELIGRFACSCKYENIVMKCKLPGMSNRICFGIDEFESFLFCARVYYKEEWLWFERDCYIIIEGTIECCPRFIDASFFY